MEIEVDQAPWQPEACRLRVDELRTAWSERRVVRNWNEGLEGEAPAALLAVLAGLRANSGHELCVVSFVECGLVDVLLGRLRRCPPAEERPLVRWGLYATYAWAPSLRASLRAKWGSELIEFARSPTWRWVIAPLLGALKCAVEGMPCGETSTHVVAAHVVKDVLRPLHKPDDFAEWRDQLPLVGTYHAELSACMVAAVRTGAVGVEALAAVIEAWPNTSSASTSKEIALLSELEELLTARNKSGDFALSDASLDDVLSMVLGRLTKAVASENWRLIERALHMWRREDFVGRFARRADATCGALLPALMRDGTPHWNPTVNRMTVLVLDRLQEMDGALERAAEALPAKLQTDTSLLVRDMRGWRPGSKEAPPASITGVAPWAMQQQPKAMAKEEQEQDPMERLRSFKAQCAVVAAQSGGGSHEAAEAAQQEFAAALVAEAPARLPELKFHDLVFGRELGSGAFGVVKYAKRIVRPGDPSSPSPSRAHWPDLAVKVFSRAKVEANRYAGSIAREICVLKKLDHPGVARLVSAFTWRKDVFLVLEYGGGGDLHETVAADGALDLRSTRFVVGSVVAALESVHDAGFVYTDLKPENVLLTQAGHVKLTDFGASRGSTPEARAKLDAEARSALAELRDGDWRQSSEPSSEPPLVVEDEEDYARVEGTALYLAPELVRGETPGLPADVWALGCLVHFCVEARPRFEADDDVAAKRQILAFTTPTFAPTTPKLAADLETFLLRPDPDQRPSLAEAARHTFFANLDLSSLYRMPPVSPLGRAQQTHRDKIVPPADAKWAQRQYSMIWAPLANAESTAKQEERDFGAWIHVDIIPESPLEAAVLFAPGAPSALPDTASATPTPAPSSSSLRPPKVPKPPPSSFAQFDAIAEE